MKLFNTRQPRHYRRISIYTDDTQDHLQKLVNQVKREQGETITGERYDPDKFRGTFSNYTPRAQRHKEGEGMKIGWPIAILLIFALIVVWRFLLTGRL